MRSNRLRRSESSIGNLRELICGSEALAQDWSRDERKRERQVRERDKRDKRDKRDEKQRERDVRDKRDKRRNKKENTQGMIQVELHMPKR
jgi:hypothetical protein